jgi:hypothetical protein
MLHLLLITATALMLAGTSAAAELPTYEVTDFPITPHQVVVVGSVHVQEQSPTPTLTLGGMPTSPHQIAVLTPCSRMPSSGLGLSRWWGERVRPLENSQ